MPKRNDKSRESSSWPGGAGWILAAGLAVGLHLSLRSQEPPPSPPVPTTVSLATALAESGFVVRGQGARGTCSVFVVAQALEVALAKRRGKAVRLSPEFLNWATNAATGRTDDGDFFHHCLEGFAKYGICAEGDLEYRSTYVQDLVPPPSALEAARVLGGAHADALKVHWIQTLPKQPGITRAHLEEIKRRLREGWPVAGGSYHSVLFIGYRDAVEDGTVGVLIARDSARVADIEISYEEALRRFGDVFWIEGHPENPAETKLPDLRPGR